MFCYEFSMKEKGLLAFPSCYKLIPAITYLNAKYNSKHHICILGYIKGRLFFAFLIQSRAHYLCREISLAIFTRYFLAWPFVFSNKMVRNIF